MHRKTANPAVSPMQRKVAILQSNYIPWKGYFDLIDSVDVFVVYDIVQYTKNDWRNRNYLKSKQGREWLSIPVHHSTSQAINETRVSDSRWWKKHFKTIEQRYARAACFDLYREPLRALYQSLADEVLLSNINIAFIRFINQALGINSEIRDAETFNCDGGQTARLVNICRQLNAASYVSGPSAKSYLDTALFNRHGIEVHWFHYGEYPPYRQLGSGFEHGVSVLDLLFNEGPEARKYMRAAQ